MASEVKTNKVSPSTGTDVTLGDSSDTFTVPSGSAIVIASGGDINVESSGEIDIASGATLDVNGTIDLTGATKTGFPAGGLTDASQWRLTTSFTSSAEPIASNLEEVDAPVGFGVLGSSMTESSGLFTFPSTGYWFIQFHTEWSTPNDNSWIYSRIYTTTDDSTYAKAAQGNSYGKTDSSVTVYTNANTFYIFDVTSTSTHKIRFDIIVYDSSTTTVGESNDNRTCMTFLRLADT